jgi:hypothetical protein
VSKCRLCTGRVAILFRLQLIPLGNHVFQNLACETAYAECPKLVASERSSPGFIKGVIMPSLHAEGK